MLHALFLQLARRGDVDNLSRVLAFKCKNRVFVSGFSFSSVVFISLFLFLLHFLKCQYVIISSIVTILIIIIYLIYIFIYLPIYPFVLLLPSILTKSYSLNYVTKSSPASCTSRPPPSPSTHLPLSPFHATPSLGRNIICELSFHA